MSRRIVVCLLVLFVAPSAVMAQDPAPYLTWVRYFKSNPGEERELVKLLTEVNAETFDGLVRDGKLLSWGIAVPFTRQGNDWSLAVWLSFANWSHMDQVMEVMIAAEAQRGPEKERQLKERMHAIMDSEYTHDEVFRNLVVPSTQPGKNADQPPVYIRVSHYRVHSGRNDDAVELYKKYALPVYEQLVADGAAKASGLAVREMMPDTEWTHLSWVMTGDLAGVDQIQEAFSKAEKARSTQQQEDFMTSVREILDMEAYRSQLLRIVHLGGQS